MSAQQKPEPGVPGTGVTVHSAEAPALRYELRSPIADILRSDAALSVIGPFIPHGLDYSVVISEVYRAGVKDPKILKCTPASIVDAVSTVVQTGLVVGRTIHLVPTSVNVAPKGATKKYEDRLQAWTDYKGDIELVVRSGAARHVDGHAVYDGDIFEVTLGSNPDVVHRPNLDPAKRGKLKGAYSIAFLNGSGTLRKVTWMPIADIETVRAKSKSWNSDNVPVCPEWYAIKTAIHKNCKTLPKNEKLARVIAIFDRQDALDAGEILPGEGISLDPAKQIPGQVLGLTGHALPGDKDHSPYVATAEDGAYGMSGEAPAPDDSESLGLPFAQESAPAAAHVPLECETYKIPDGLGPKSGQTLGSLSKVDLEQLYRWAGKQSAMNRFPGLSEQCGDLLEARRLGDAKEPAAS